MSSPPRSDSFYRFTVAAGLLMALFALAWGRWSLGQGQERLFAVDEQQISARASVEEQKAATSRIEAYGAAMQRALAAEKDRGARFLFLTDETERTAKRLAAARIELDRRKELADARARQAVLLQKQMEIDAGRSDGLTILGLTLTVTGFLLWYLRRQRHLDASLRVPRGQASQFGDMVSPWDEAAVWNGYRPDETAMATGGREESSPGEPR